MGRAVGWVTGPERCLSAPKATGDVAQPDMRSSTGGGGLLLLPLAFVL